MNMVYGSCIGMIRFDRWNRVNKLGLNFFKEIEIFLKVGNVRFDCLWDGWV